MISNLRRDVFPKCLSDLFTIAKSFDHVITGIAEHSKLIIRNYFDILGQVPSLYLFYYPQHLFDGIQDRVDNQHIKSKGNKDKDYAKKS